MLESGRLEPATTLGLSGSTEKSNRVSFSRMPVPSATRPEAKVASTVLVTATMLPSASMME